ncbi:Phosphate import ATP-binding protein PstB 1 [bacterium HR11]|nr:Phosphate import ATP-binding protein PstB 1 [bacterium HR11]
MDAAVTGGTGTEGRRDDARRSDGMDAAGGFETMAQGWQQSQTSSKHKDLLVELRDRYTIVIVTHNVQQAARISDHTAFFLTEPFGSGKSP